MKYLIKTLFIFRVFLIASLLFMSHSVSSEPPSRVARLSYFSHIVSFLPAGEAKWVKASLNRPLITGDDLWTDWKARAELQLGLAVIRLDERTNLKVLNLTKQLAQFQLNIGTVTLKITRTNASQHYEIDTPNRAISMTEAGYYRIEVKNGTTSVSIRGGRATVYGKAPSLTIKNGTSCRFSATATQTHTCTKLTRFDEFDKWVMTRDRPARVVKTHRYVSSEVIGAADLDQHGSWRMEKNYGPIWYPEVDDEWVPYRDGHWIWVRGWGWTWVDDEPWGFAPFHYGRWAYVNQRWGWIPGPREVVPVYAPALVVFVGGNQFEIARNTAGVAWFPLGPGEVYVPNYETGEQYFTQVNISNTYINRTYVERVYRNQNMDRSYQNIRVNNAVTAVSATAFVQSRPVEAVAVSVPAAQVMNAPKSTNANIAPDSASVYGGKEEAVAKPSAEVLKQPVVVNTEPPPPPVPFSEEKKTLEENPGLPITPEDVPTLPTEPVTPQETLPQPDASKPAEVPTPPAQPDATTPAEVPTPPAQPDVPPTTIPEDVPVVPESQPQPNTPTVEAPAPVVEPEVPESIPSEPIPPETPQPEVPAPEIQPDVPQQTGAPQEPGKGD